MKEDRASVTSMLVAAARALYARWPPPFGTSPDPSAVDLLPPWARAIVRAASSVPAAAPLVHRALGPMLLGLSWHVALRTRAIDEALDDALDAGAHQLVLLGAGLDNRARRIPRLAADSVSAFEVDHPDTQRDKLDKLSSAGLPHAATFVSIDFEREHLDERLLAAGFSPSVVSFWIWEGVTVYLTPSAVEATLAAVARISAPGSRLAMTYTTPASVSSPAFRALVRALGAAVGESVRGLLSTEAAHSLLRAAGFRILSDEAPRDLALRAWPSTPAGLREWERLVIAERL